MTHLEKRLAERFRALPSQAAPGFCLQVARRGKKVIDLRWGKTWEYYDLASVTKIIFTTTQLMRVVSEKKIDLDKSLSTYLGWYPHASVTTRQLLSHSAGNEWWKPFYKEISLYDNLYEKKQILKTLIRAMPLSRNKKSVYSDIDFFLLGFLLEGVLDKPLVAIWEEFLRHQLPENRMHFNQENKPLYPRSQYAPTEICAFRKKGLQGEVHDENTWVMEGVGAHAGLFGRAQDVLDWGLWLRQVWRGKNAYIQPAVAREFFKRSMGTKYGDWGLGFMLPTKGNASCGPYFSLDSVGHTGFTGTSFWMDTQKDIIVVLLSNRVYPTRQNEIFRQVRPQIHDAIIEEIKRNL